MFNCIMCNKAIIKKKLLDNNFIIYKWSFHKRQFFINYEAETLNNNDNLCEIITGLTIQNNKVKF